MTGRVVQISISPGGVPKRPIPEGLITRLGLEGDRHANMQVHGGPLQALLLITSEAIQALVAQGHPVYFGALGENITTEGIDHRQMRSGQRYRIGEAFIELTKLRAPCKTLNVYGSIQKDLYDAQAKAGDPGSTRWAVGGYYASVIRPGRVRQDDIIALVDHVV